MGSEKSHRAHECAHTDVFIFTHSAVRPQLQKHWQDTAHTHVVRSHSWFVHTANVKWSPFLECSRGSSATTEGPGGGGTVVCQSYDMMLGLLCQPVTVGTTTLNGGWTEVTLIKKQSIYSEKSSIRLVGGLFLCCDKHLLQRSWYHIIPVSQMSRIYTQCV